MAIFVLVFMVCQCDFLMRGIFGEGERTYEEKPFREEAFGLREVGCQEGGHGGSVFLEVVFVGNGILLFHQVRWCWVV